MASHPLCKTTVAKTYQDVIKDVISNVREDFVDEGVDESILQELQALWEQKLTASKTFQDITLDPKQTTSSKQPIKPIANSNIHYQRSGDVIQTIGQVPPNNHVPHLSYIEWRRIPLQLSLPANPNPLARDEPRTIIIEVPELFITQNHLKSVLSPSIIGQTVSLNVAQAANFIQNRIDEVSHQFRQGLMKGLHVAPISQTDGADDEHLQYKVLTEPNLKIPQGDAPVDTSDEEDSCNKSDDVAEEEKVEEDVEEEVGGAEEEPLNSEDDEDDADDANQSFDTDNVMVCQFDKISRCRNRWKFHLKDGIMNLNGQDYVFQKANGDAEW